VPSARWTSRLRTHNGAARARVGAYVEGARLGACAPGARVAALATGLTKLGPTTHLPPQPSRTRPMYRRKRSLSARTCVYLLDMEECKQCLAVLAHIHVCLS
jgi:hypothetical protein